MRVGAMETETLLGIAELEPISARVPEGVVEEVAESLRGDVR